MTAIKKSTSKITTSPAPATKTAKAVATRKTAPAVLTPPRAATPQAVAVTPVKPVPPKPAVAFVPAATPKAARTPAPVAMPKPAVTPKPVIAPKPVVTSITARIDVGFGNALYVRGDGPGLSWDKGVLMNCVGDDEWALDLGESARPFTVKFLVNDVTWSSGPDYTVPARSRVTLAPQF